jgi:hypothetical protein
MLHVTVDSSPFRQQPKAGSSKKRHSGKLALMLHIRLFPARPFGVTSGCPADAHGAIDPPRPSMSLGSITYGRFASDVRG